MSMPKDLATRTKRAQAMAAMGLIKRANDHFLVGTQSLKGQPSQHKVWRNQIGKVCCTCEEFNQAVKDTPGFRCEHILAVKLLLAVPTPEAVKPLPPHQAATNDAAPVAPTICNSLSITPSTKPATVEEGEIVMTKPHPITETRPADTASPFNEILKKLSAPIPLELIKQREGWQGRNGLTHFVDYIEWHTVADLLDQNTPDWSHAVRAVTQIGDLVAVTASITINGVTREGIGTGSAESEMGIKKAEHDALKRAAVKFGVARELYKHADDGDETPATPALPRDPLAKTLADLVTPKQLVALRAIAHAQGLEAEQECLTLYGCKLEELSRQAASALIDHFKVRQTEDAPEQWRRAV
jgi:hypothetical protein